MFTGIVEAVGRVVAIEPAGGKTRLRVEAPGVAEGAPIGASIAVNGACLTVVEAGAEQVVFEAVPETLARSALGDLRAGARVNLERALRADGRLDGHLVQGHVDGTGRVRALERRGGDVRLAVDCEPELARQLVPKGSVAVDGVSLTLAGVSESGFEVALIPHTLAVTTLGERQPGERVNLEADVLGKYVLRYLERVLGEGGIRR
ncbi:MAG: riboflavin synthase [Deltaproteobacteria bacterium]|nr:riboflavin synthase [Deltaproteobacteria bacterium]